MRRVASRGMRLDTRATRRGRTSLRPRSVAGPAGARDCSVTPKCTWQRNGWQTAPPLGYFRMKPAYTAV
jgi:hypothetical protein